MLGRLIKPIIIIAIIIALALGILWYLSQGIEEASLERFTIEEITSITTESFTVKGTLHVHNPSNLPVPIQEIRYNVTLENTGEQIGSGTIDTFMLGASTTTAIPFEQTINWVPTTSLATTLILEEETNILIEGVIYINLPEVREYAIPFSQTTTIEEYLEQFVSAQTITQTTNNVLNNEEEQEDDSSNNDSSIPELPTVLG